ncbi:MAG TPA: molybdopterin synthase catalytic subunit MoaE [Candidatus Thioglobus sp.]|nr:molybdopterin synthase catalytic subunit MoaE [Candidatus Thioglobus sp.]HIL20429.1 molybdopterin synthase catalytic subunit MoaE [Candidatus Thioglobus sp.]
MDKIIVQEEDFDLSTEVRLAREGNLATGAIVSFVGTVRDLEGDSLSSMTLEHYPQMTEKSLEKIVSNARKRWDIQSTTIIHRIGELQVQDQIVLVIVTSKHRGEAFDACHFIMDYLKTDAPFWKKESINNKDSWVESRESDDQQKNHWKN